MRGCLLRDMSAWGCLPRRVSAKEGCLLRDMSAWGVSA